MSTYHIDELNESQSERDLNFLGHVLHGPNEFVVAAKEIANESLLLLGTRAYKREFG